MLDCVDEIVPHLLKVLSRCPPRDTRYYFEGFSLTTTVCYSGGFQIGSGALTAWWCPAGLYLVSAEVDFRWKSRAAVAPRANYMTRTCIYTNSKWHLLAVHKPTKPSSDAPPSRHDLINQAELPATKASLQAGTHGTSRAAQTLLACLELVKVV